MSFVNQLFVRNLVFCIILFTTQIFMNKEGKEYRQAISPGYVIAS